MYQYTQLHLQEPKKSIFRLMKNRAFEVARRTLNKHCCLRLNYGRASK